MSVVVHCPCGWEGAVDDSLAGQSVRCLACGASLAVPELPGGAAAASVPVQQEPLIPASTLDIGSASPVERPDFNSTAKVKAAAFFKHVRRVVGPVWKYVREAFRFYWSHRDLLRAGARLWITEYLPALDPPEDFRREIRTPLADEGRLQEVDGVWRLELPNRCVVCGKTTPRDWNVEGRPLLDTFSLIAAPLAGVGIGIILGGWYRSLTCLVVAPIAGLLAGYALRRRVTFELRFKRCGQHVGDVRSPELAVFHGKMVLRLGTREVKLAYLRPDGDLPDSEEVVPAPYPADMTPPHTIALADFVDPDAAIIPEDTADRLESADDAYDVEKRAPDSGSSGSDDPTI